MMLGALMRNKFLAVLWRSLLFAAAIHAQTSLTVLSSANWTAPVAPYSLDSAFGSNLSSQTAAVTGLPLPITLGGVSVEVSDSAGMAQSAGLLFVSPGQINFLMPTVAIGPVTVMVISGSNVVARGAVQVQPSAAGVYSADTSGSGVAAAEAAVAVDVVGPVKVSPVFQCGSPQQCQPIPLNLGLDTPTILELFGTGIRGGTSISATIGNMPVAVLYAGPQPDYPGLDQVNLPLSLSLRGAGTVNVVLTVDGRMSNAVEVAIQ